MIPYVTLDPVHAWGVTIRPFALAVIVGIGSFSVIGIRRAVRRGERTSDCVHFVLTLVPFGMAGAHLGQWLLYHPAEIAAHPALLLRSNGLAVFPGYLGMMVGALLWKYFALGGGRWGFSLRRRARPRDLLLYADHFFAVCMWCQCIGRLGCALEHDHLSLAVDPSTWWAVGCGEGPREHWGPLHVLHGTIPRLDLGLLEMLTTGAIALAITCTWSRSLPKGTYTAVAALAHSPIRFVMDFYRMPAGEPGGDARYAGLTPAQWGCFACFAAGCVLAARIVARRTARRRRLAEATA